MEEQTDKPTNALKRPCEDHLESVKRQRVLGDGENSGDNSTAGILRSVDEIHADISEVLQEAEKEKERITRESTEAVQKRLQERSQALEQIPGFWPLALRQSRAKDYLAEDDDKLLEFLTEIEVTDVENSLLNITLRFKDDNPYLESTEITRIVSLQDPNIVSQVSAVNWKPGQEFSAPLENGAGAFDSCNFFQRIMCLPHFDTVDRILYDIFWDPMKYYRGTADLDAERQELEQELAQDFVEEEEPSSDDNDSDADLEVEVGVEGVIPQEDAEEEEEDDDADGDEDDDAL